MIVFYLAAKQYIILRNSRSWWPYIIQTPVLILWTPVFYTTWW